MEKISTYKDRALESLKGKWGKGAVATLIYVAIVELGSVVFTFALGQESLSSSLLQILWTILCMPLVWGLATYFLGLIRNEGLEYGKLFDGYKDFGRITLIVLLYGLAVTIGCILLLVPGIIVAMMFSQWAYIAKENPQMGAVDVLKKSAQMMDGHKLQLFLLELSFIGWGILALFTLGIGFLFLIPYMYTTTAHYYEDLKEEQALLNE